ENSMAGKQQLAQALDNAELRKTANRLQMAVSARLNDLEGYQHALERLEQWQQETLLDRLGYWQLLVVNGRKAEAKELAQAYAYPPASPLEVLRLVSVYSALGMPDYSLQFINRYLSDFGYAPQLWLLNANLLIEQKHWDQLRNLATQLRQQPRLRDTMAGYSYFLEGRAE